MKTLKKITFPGLANEYLENILRQLVLQHAVLQVFYTPQDSGLSYLVVHLEEQHDLELLQSRPWVRKARERCQVAVSFVSSSQLEHRYSLGHPFTACYCTAASLIYAASRAISPPHPDSGWKRHKKKFRAFSERFFHDREMLCEQLEHLIAEDAGNCIFTSYGRLLEFDLQHLEELYCGKACDASQLAARIHILLPHLPSLQSLFVPGRGDGYYLTDLIEEVRTWPADEPFYHEELHGALAATGLKLYGLAQERYREMRRLLKKRAVGAGALPAASGNAAPAILPEGALDVILERHAVEQAYLFHQRSCGSKTTLYLLLVARGLGSEKLGRLTQSLNARLGEGHHFVLVSHDRRWIQAHLYDYQNFFRPVMQEPFLAYSSHSCHPEPYWKEYHHPPQEDLWYYCRPMRNSASQFLAIASSGSGNYQGLDGIFASFFLSFCRVLIYNKADYLPHRLSSRALWQLCLYADEGLRRHQHLIDNFWTDFFRYVDKHTTAATTLTPLDSEKVAAMQVLVEQLQDEVAWREP